MEIKQFVFDFVAGSVHPKVFIETLEQHSEIYDWLQSIVPEGLTCYENRMILDRFGEEEPISIEIPYDIKIVIKQHLDDSKKDRWGLYLNIHDAISKLLKKAFPHENINVSDEIEKRFDFGLTAIPEYLGGIDVADFIDDVVDSIPQNLSKTVRVRLCKEKLREKFHIEGKNIPRWIQDPEWPVGEDGTPMKFVSQKRKKGKPYDTMLFTEFLFEDVKTGKQRIVEQFT
jgi:hypothetical protein